MSYTHHELSSIVVVHNITVAEPGVKFKEYPPPRFFLLVSLKIPQDLAFWGH